MPQPRRKSTPPTASNYQHTEATQPLRPEVGTQPLFKKKKEPATYRYDSSLSPALDWDNNPAREQGEALIAEIVGQASRLSKAVADFPDKQAAAGAAALQDAAQKLRALSKPFLNWTGKAERLSFDVPTLPLFVHERLSTRAILETLKAHKRDKQEDFVSSLFGNASLPVTDQVLRAYEHREQWQNRMILGDSLVVMNSLAKFENLGGQVQMIYVDPPYGVKFGSNFQPFVRKRDVTHGDDADLTREPEMVQAYRDTWELGLHSYLTYLRDRLLLARDLLHPSGSIFVQISDENLHHVRELMDEVFGAKNFVANVAFQTATNQNTKTIQRLYDYVVWYARDAERIKCHRVYRPRTPDEIEGTFDHIDENGRRFKAAQIDDCTEEELEKLRKAKRITEDGKYGKRFPEDFAHTEMDNVWWGTVISTFSKEKLYVVQTSRPVIQRCMLMTTDPGDLVLDPTCGSGTTAYVAEQWGRRWLTIDTSRVPLALARQRLLTATFDYYELNDEKRGPASGFVYKRHQNAKGEEVGGIVPHVTLGSIATNEPPGEEVLVDRPEIKTGIVRVTGPFTVEATIPTSMDVDMSDCHSDPESDEGEESPSSAGNDRDPSTSLRSAQDDKFRDRMIEVLRRNPVLRLGGNRSVTLRQVRPPARTLSLHAEALVEKVGQASSLSNPSKTDKQDACPTVPVAFVFGPENGAVSGKLVENAAIEARRKDYSHLYVIGFAIEAGARKAIEESDAAFGIPATYVQATPDILMGDLLKTMRSSQIFSVCGLPEVKVNRQDAKNAKTGETLYQVELLGLDVFDPVEMKSEHRSGMDVPAWLLDTDYNGTVFRVCQAFFPRTGAWESLKRELRSEFEESVWAHLAGTTSAPFPAGQHKTIAVKVIDDRGNELLVTKELP